jgi:hypothetical protein
MDEQETSPGVAFGRVAGFVSILFSLAWNIFFCGSGLYSALKFRDIGPAGIGMYAVFVIGGSLVLAAFGGVSIFMAKRGEFSAAPGSVGTALALIPMLLTIVSGVLFMLSLFSMTFMML